MLFTKIKLQQVHDDCDLTIGEIGKQIPIEVKRVYFLTNASPNKIRGKHAHKDLRQVMVCIKGAVKIVAKDGISQEEVVLDSQSDALFLQNLVWHEIHGMDNQTVLLVLASKEYTQDDYITDYQEFLNIRNKHEQGK